MIIGKKETTSPNSPKKKIRPILKFSYHLPRTGVTYSASALKLEQHVFYIYLVQVYGTNRNKNTSY